MRSFPNVTGVRGFVWADLDLDGDPDAGLLDGEGVVHVFRNEQGGLFRPWLTPMELGAVAGITVGDLNADGVLDLIALETGGTVQSLSATGDRRAWVLRPVTTWATMPPEAPAGAYRKVAQWAMALEIGCICRQGRQRHMTWKFDRIWFRIRR